MEVSNLLTDSIQRITRNESPVATLPPPQQLHKTGPFVGDSGYMMGSVYQNYGATDAGPAAVPLPQPPKHVSFELLLQESPQHRARLPMRVNIWPHDTTESIVATVKNFHGIYDGQGYGVSFEDKDGNTLIARYENFYHNMTVYVRRIPQEVDDYNHTPRHSMSPRKSRLEEPFNMPPPGQYSRPSSQTARNRSLSPDAHRGRRSLSRSTNSKSRSRPGLKVRATSSHGSMADLNGDYSDSEAGEGSVTSSRRENLASADISLDNIVEGGRRKRAKFDSSVSVRCHHICEDQDSNSACLGTALVRTPSGAHDDVHLVCFAPETNQQHQRCFSLLLLEPADIFIHQPASLAAEPWGCFVHAGVPIGNSVHHLQWAAARTSAAYTWHRTVSPAKLDGWCLAHA